MELSRQMYMNPTTHSQSMTTWRVVGTPNILSNSLRILNMKFNFDELSTFKDNVGVWGCVKRIRFLNLNGVEIDSFENVPQIMSLMLSMSDVETAKDITQPLYGTNFYQVRDLVSNFPLGTVNANTAVCTPLDPLVLGQLGVGDVVKITGVVNALNVVFVKRITNIPGDGTFTVDSVFSAANNMTVGVVRAFSKISILQNEVIDIQQKQLRLVRCLDYLRKTSTLNNGYLLQVEWDTSFVNWTTPVDPAQPAGSYNLEPPILAFEVYSRPLPNPKVVSYYTLKTNKVQIPAIANVGESQTVEPDLKGFKGLFIRRMLLINTNQAPTAGDVNRDTADFGYFASLAQANENINFALDGKTLMTYKGLFSNAQKSGLLNDLWGSVLAYQGSDKLVNTRSVYGPSSIGNRAYGCVEIDALINKEFVINYSRVGLDAERQVALTLHCVAEVLKTYDEEKGLIGYMLM